MKKLTLLLILTVLLLFAQMARAQTYHPFPKDSAEWVSYRDFFSPWLINESVQGETIINGQKYIRTNYNEFVLRADTSKKVFAKFFPNNYCQFDTTEFLIYDFSLQVGDTFMAMLCDPVINQTPDTVYWRVVSTDTINTNIDTRKAYHLLPLSEQIFAGGCDNNFYWIEGIGSTITPFYFLMIRGECFEFNAWLLCHTEQGEYVLGDSTCHTVSVPENAVIEPPNATIIPNPITDDSYVQFVGIEPVRIEVYSLSGSLVYTEPIQLQSKILLRQFYFPSGLYLCRIIDADGIFINIKFIVN